MWNEGAIIIYSLATLWSSLLSCVLTVPWKIIPAVTDLINFCYIHYAPAHRLKALMEIKALNLMSRMATQLSHPSPISKRRQEPGKRF